MKDKIKEILREDVKKNVLGFPITRPNQELVKLKVSYDALIARLNLVWVELQNHKPKNITPQEKKKFATAVFEICAKHELKNFTGLFFGLGDGKVSSIEEFMLNYDDKTLYKIL